EAGGGGGGGGVAGGGEGGAVPRRSLGDQKRLYAVSFVYAQDSRYHLALRILRRHFLTYARSGDPSLPRGFWEMFYPLGWRAELTEAAGGASMDPPLLAAVGGEGGSFYPPAPPPGGARRVVQLQPGDAPPGAPAARR